MMSLLLTYTMYVFQECFHSALKCVRCFSYFKSFGKKRDRVAFVVIVNI